jgi:hypothetical protein
MKRIEEENQKKKLKGNSFGGKGRNQVSVQMDADLNSLELVHPHDRTTLTREQRAKLSGVSTGTVARYHTVSVVIFNNLYAVLLLNMTINYHLRYISTRCAKSIENFF